MAKKPLNPLEDPPTASSSDDDEVETSAGEEDEGSSSSSSSDESKDPVKAPSSAVTIAVPGKSSAVATATAAAKQASDSDSGSETETDSDSDTERPKNPPNGGSGKAVAVTVVSSAAKPKKSETAKPVAKRPSEWTSRDSSAKRAKKVITSGEEEKKAGEETRKPAFHRLWSEEDEISVLQGMIDFKSDTGKSPYEDSNGFYEFIKKSISFEVSKNQFMDKIRSLKKKYMGKGKNGLVPSFTKPHDQKSYELSKFIWGPNGMALESAVKSNGVSKKSQKTPTKKIDSVKQELTFSSPNGKKVEDDVHGGDVVVEPLVAVVRKPDWFENSFLVPSIAGFGVDEHYVKRGWSLVPVENKKKIEEKLKALNAKEMEFVLEKTGFLHEVTSMIAEASKMKSLDI